VADDTPSLSCAFCQYGDSKLPLRFWHIMALHAALDHESDGV
jgi:hypothetical protein